MRALGDEDSCSGTAVGPPRALVSILASSFPSPDPTLVQVPTPALTLILPRLLPRVRATTAPFLLTNCPFSPSSRSSLPLPLPPTPLPGPPPGARRKWVMDPRVEWAAWGYWDGE